jgi:hypothetical protein
VAARVRGHLIRALRRPTSDHELRLPYYALMYQNTNGVLIDDASAYGPFNTGRSMALGTSPSAAPITGGYMFVWQGANHDLWTTSATGPVDTRVAMAPGTSPSLATMSNGT